MHNILCGNQNGENSGANEACNLKFKNITHPDALLPTVTTEK
jgi:DNA polymerase-3 subunit delta'